MLAFLLLILPLASFAQSGPGGVSNDADDIKNCRLWLDARDLSYLGDGSNVYVWKDKSYSTHVDTAIWLDSFQEKFDAPLFRSDPAYSINGKPVISFEDGGMLLMGRDQNNKNQNPDLSADGPLNPAPKRTVFLAFRTGNNITSRQYLWEQGGGWKGMGIFISNSYLYIGVYNLPSGDGISQFGYSYKKAQVQPNTTYVVSMVLDAPTDGSLNTSVINNTALRGTINGGHFGNLEQGASKSTLPLNGFGVGAIGAQGDPIGIGGVNSLAADETSINDWSSAGNPCVGFTPCNNTLLKADSGQTGQFTFKGRIAEIAYYAYSLNAAERIIVENYLAAKYFANVITNDKYQYKSNFGHDVIGIGAEFQDGDYQEHNISKGDNLFEMSVSDMNAAFKFSPDASRYLLAGHNNNPLVWTTQNTPDSANVQRLRRTWRFDRSGTPGDQSVKIRFAHPDSATGLPQLPADYIYAVLTDDSNGPLPNFSSSSHLTEIVLNPSTGWYEGEFNIPHGAYLTLAAVKPTIQFKKSTDFAIEGNPPPTSESKTVKVELNYAPRQAGDIQAGVIFSPVTAIPSDDYTNTSTITTITPPNKTGTISFDIVNDEVADNPPVKKFLIVLDPATTPAGFFIGERDTLTYSIYDDDSDPKATFASANDEVLETAGPAPIEVLILGNPTSSSTVKITDMKTGSADYGVHYDLPSGDGWFIEDGLHSKIISFPVGEDVSVIVDLPVFDSGINDYDKTIDLIIEPGENIAVDDDSILEHTLRIKNDNPEPTVEFLASSSEGFRVVSQPRIVVKLSAPSGKFIEVPFSITGGSAINGAYQSNSDYNATNSGTVLFLPGSTISYLYYDPSTGNIPLQVYTGDGTGTMPDKTIEFELQGPAVNAGLGDLNRLNHTYTIKDYLPFEWSGAAGVGRLRDNTFWINVDGESVGSKPAEVTQLSTRPISIKQSTPNNRPEIALGTNNQKVMRFNGSSNFYRVNGSQSSGSSPYINTGGFYDSKSIFFVVKPATGMDENIPQVIYEEGGNTKGLSIYLRDKKLYFQAWNTTDDDGVEGNLAPWGGNTSYAVTDDLIMDQTYVVSCHYNNTELDGATGPGLRIFVNGELQGTYGSASQKVGRLYVHSQRIGIGGIDNETRFNDGPDGSSNGKYFKGDIGEMIYYNESGYAMNTARIRIIHNYLSARFNVPLTTEQVFNLQYADRTNTNEGYVAYNNDVAGIGIVASGNLHGVAQGRSAEGPSQLKITGTNLNGIDKFLMWGHNGESFTNTWPFSYGNASLPAPVKERSGRVWRFSTNSGMTSMDGITVEMNYSESSNATALTMDRNLFRLLVSSDPNDWSNATVYNISATQPAEAEGARVVFEGVNIPNGAFMALGNTSPITVSPLPIELLSFTARFEVDHVNLRWVTSTEHNNDFFAVERAGGDLKWEEILTVPGAGMSTTELTYYKKDRNPLLGVSYYRLKQVDFDGTYTYSDVVSVLNTKARDEDAVFMFPNPTSAGSVFLRIPDATKVFDTKVRIFSLQGTVVWSGSFAADSNLLEIRFGDLTPGLYLVEIQSEVIYESKKLVIH